MKACDVKLGQLIKTEYGLATVMKFYAPKSIGCIIVTADSRKQRFPPGEWIYLRGFDFDKAEIVANGN